MRKDFEQTADHLDDMSGPPPNKAKPPVITLDVSLYETYLADSEMTDGQKHEFLQALWSIIVGFVDLGFGVHPLQQALEPGADASALEPGELAAKPHAPSQQEEKHHKTTQSLRAQIARSFVGKEES